MKSKKFKSYEDDIWETMDDFYGEDLELNDSEFAREVLGDEDTSDLSDKDRLVYENEDVEYVDNIILDLFDENGQPTKYELICRIDIYDRTYLGLHPIEDADESLVAFCRAFDDEDGNLQVAEIKDEDEYNEVIEQFNKLMYDDENAMDIEGGGVQWDD